jgi:hypothetical protein
MGIYAAGKPFGALYARQVVFGDAEVLETVLFVKEVATLMWNNTAISVW